MGPETTIPVIAVVVLLAAALFLKKRFGRRGGRLRDMDDTPPSTEGTRERIEAHLMSTGFTVLAGKRPGRRFPWKYERPEPSGETTIISIGQGYYAKRPYSLTVQRVSGGERVVFESSTFWQPCKSFGRTDFKALNSLLASAHNR